MAEEPVLAEMPEMPEMALEEPAMAITEPETALAEDEIIIEDSIPEEPIVNEEVTDSIEIPTENEAAGDIGAAESYTPDNTEEVLTMEGENVQVSTDDYLQDIDGFLVENDYEYTKAEGTNGTEYIVRRGEGAMLICFENGEFVSFDKNYTKNGKQAYSAIILEYIKDAIAGSGSDSLFRHKGSNI